MHFLVAIEHYTYFVMVAHFITYNVIEDYYLCTMSLIYAVLLEKSLQLDTLPYIFIINNDGSYG